MSRKFRPSELEQDFDLLFGRQSKWQWPFWDGSLFSSVWSLFWGALLASVFVPFFLGVFDLRFHFKMWEYAGMAFFYSLISNNFVFLRDWRRRRSLERKYFPAIEHTEAFALLLEGVERRRQGVLEGFENESETRAFLVKMWRAAFVEASQIETPFLLTGGFALDERPIADQMREYFKERQVATDELDNVIKQTGSG